jgi:hypothetical protein
MHNTKEKKVKNTISISGTIKNVRTYESKSGKGTMLTGWLDQRDVSRTSDGTADRQIYVVGMKIVAFDNNTVADILGATKAGQEVSLPITLTGRMVTKFDTRDVPEDKKYKPMLQLEVHDVEVNA